MKTCLKYVFISTYISINFIIPDIQRCGPVPYYADTSVSYVNHTLGSVVSVACNDGFRYDDGYLTKDIECMASTLTWEPELPTCTGTCN